MDPRIRTGPIAAVWLGGGLLAVLAYAVGPNQVLRRAWDLVASSADALEMLGAQLEAASFDLVRALAIGAFGAFVLLALMAIRRGLRGRGALVAVSLVFLATIAPGAEWSAGDWSGASWSGRQSWFLVLLLALTGAASMTGRLLRAGARPAATPVRPRKP